MTEKKKNLNNLYNKIIQQSKETSILEDFDSQVSLNIELLQINLSIILWYMKGQKIKQKYLDFLISRFIKDLEAASIELGFAESGLKKNCYCFVLSCGLWRISPLPEWLIAVKVSMLLISDRY